MSEKPKDIQVVEGDGSELDISLVHDHINNIQQPRKKRIEEIVIPEVKKKESTKKEDKKEDIEDEEDVENVEEEDN